MTHAPSQPTADDVHETSALTRHGKYDAMLRLADYFDTTGDELRTRARLATEILADEAITDSAELSPGSYGQFETDLRTATNGRHGLLSRSLELDADALVIRATVLTYQWIDELQAAAYQTLGSIAGRAIGYLAPEVELGGAIVSAGLIETDALDREGVASYLGELAAHHPELMEHITSGGGPLLDGLQLRSLLTVGSRMNDAPAAARGGLRAAGVAPFAADTGSALRDIAGALFTGSAEEGTDGHRDVVDAEEGPPSAAPRSIGDLMERLDRVEGIGVEKVADGRYIAYLPAPSAGRGRHLRLVGGDHTAYAADVIAAIEQAVGEESSPRVMLVGAALGGVAAAEIAADPTPRRFTIDQIVTAAAPSAHVPRIPEAIRVLSLEERSDPIALLGGLINAAVRNRVTVVYDAAATAERSSAALAPYLIGARAADTAEHPELRAEIARLGTLGYLAG